MDRETCGCKRALTRASMLAEAALISHYNRGSSGLVIRGVAMTAPRARHNRDSYLCVIFHS